MTTTATDLFFSTLLVSHETNATLPAQSQMVVLSHHSWLMPIIFGILMLIGIVGNTIVIYVIVRSKQIKTVTNYYIVNLAIADIAFLAVCAPSTGAQYATPKFLFGRFMCKFVFYMQVVTAQATCLLLTAMSIDRFQAIVRPLKSLKTRTLQTAVIISVGIWMFAFIIYIPVMVFFDIEDITFNGEVIPLCKEFWPSIEWNYLFVIWTFLMVYTIPLFVISICYSLMIRHLWQRVVPTDALSGPANERNLRQKRKITWMVLTVVVVFAVCWLPVYILQLWLRLDPNFPYTDATLDFKAAGNVLSYANSCANPFIYAFLGENFRKRFRKTFPCCFKKVGIKREGAGHGVAIRTGSLQGSSTERAGTSRRTGGAATHDTHLSTFNSHTETKGNEQS